MPKRIGLLTSGGDCPGLNAFIAAATLGGIRRGWEMIGIKYGFSGLLNPSQTITLHPDMVKDISGAGGTILGASNNVDPYNIVMEGHPRDRSSEIIKNAKQLKLDALLVAGGDGTINVSQQLNTEGLPIVCVPKTIDNDVFGSNISIGFLSAVQIATRAAEALRNTGESHRRIILLEVMGRCAGWIALYSGFASIADVIIIPEIPYSLHALEEYLKEKHINNDTSSLVIISEGIKKEGGEEFVHTDPITHEHVRLHGGAGNYVRNYLEKKLNSGIRVMVLGHLQRGGPPVVQDRIFAQQCAIEGLDLIASERFNTYVAFQEGEFHALPMSNAFKKIRTIQPDDPTVRAAEEIGILFARKT